MDFYEELGISRDASISEIRRAYRNLARILHPDQQPDETLRALAGLQMVRLNQILQTLSDPQLRLRYDNSLCGGDRNLAEAMENGHLASKIPPLYRGFPVPWRPAWKMLAWLSAGTVGILAIALLLGQERSLDTTSTLTETTSLALSRNKAPVAGARPNPVLERYRPRSLDEASEPRVAPFGAPGERVLPPDSVPSVSSGEQMFYPLGQQGVDTLAGDWFYPETPNLAPVPGLCDPIYINLEISQSGGTITGTYSAKYKVGSRRIYPHVSFEFTGSGGAPTPYWIWNGSDGSEGQIRLRLISPRHLQADWITTQPGGELAFSSGTATLVRRQLP